MSLFRVFKLFVFKVQKAGFQFQNIVKDIFLAYISSKIKVGKIAIFRPKPCVNPFGKMLIFRLFELHVFEVQKAVFSFQNIVKDIFLAYIFLKKRVGKVAIFGQKPWVNLFGKLLIFRLFELLVFIVQKGVFSFQNIVKDIFLAYIA